MKSFELLVSNDNINWKSVDKQENVVYQTPYTDGKIAYTGGINLADEYINENNRLGYWKDSAIRIKGEAIKEFINLC